MIAMKINKKAILGVFVIGLVMALLLFQGYSGSKPPLNEPTEPINIGAILWLSGEFASWGQAVQRGIEIAVQDVNTKGGIDGREINMIYEDTQGQASRVIGAYKKLKDMDNVRVIIGPDTQTSMAVVSSLVAEDDMPIVSPTYVPMEQRPDKTNPLLIWMDTDTESERMANYVYQNGNTRVAVIGTFDGWEIAVSEAFRDEFNRIGGEVTYYELLQPDAEDVRTAVTKALRDNPDAVFLGTNYLFLQLSKTLAEMEYDNSNIYSIELFDYLAQESKDYASGIRFISTDSFKDEFNKIYEERYGEKPNIPAGQSYDAMNILISFLKKDPTREGILKQMKEFKSYDGVSGKITITEDNKTLLPTAIYELRDGEIIRLQSFPKQTSI